jgi:DNA-binding beta-propeller fold protein YncE
VDPGNGDIYSINNDTLHLMTVFGRDARGNASPKRMLEAPSSVYGIAVDEEEQELFLTQQGGTIYVYNKMAKDHDRPLRFIEGPNTQLANPHGIAVDSSQDLLFVLNWGGSHEEELPEPGEIPWGDGRLFGTPAGSSETIVGSGKIEEPSITVYPQKGMGNVAPLRVIQGPKTQLNWPTAIAIDPQHGEMFVANDTGHSITVYDLEAEGDVAPKRVLKGPRTLIKNPSGVTYDPQNEELWVSNFANHAATVYGRTSSGDTPPLRIIRSAPLETPAPVLSNPHVVVYDSKRDELLVGT